MDLIGVLPSLRDAVESQAEEKFGLAPAALVLNASHTHCGPEYRERRGREEEARRYHAMLEERVVEVIGQALARLEPAALSWAEARAGFAANRRGGVGGGGGITLAGPVDHAVPVLRVDAADGQLRAVLFGYACHNTTLSSVATIDQEISARKIPAVWVAGYSNGYFGYIPSVRVLNEGGYEAGPWDASIEERIVGAVHGLLDNLR